MTNNKDTHRSNGYLDMLQELGKTNGFKIKDVNLYIQCFTHTSYANEHKMASNERLEFIGDAILDFLVGEYLFETYPNMPEGDMTKTRAKFVCEEANRDYSLKLGLDKLLLLGKGEEEQGGRTRPTVLGDLFEAFLGALFMDTKDINKVRKVLDRIVFTNIAYEKGYLVDYKSKLQEMMQAESRKSVTYILEDESGPSHEKVFRISVYFEGMKLGTGIGKNKKEAEQMSAKAALEKLAK